MSYQSDKIQLGVVYSSFKVVTAVPGNIPAGKVVHAKADGTFTIAAADGTPIGVSVGKDQSDAGYTAVCRAGLRVPILLTSGLDPAIGAQVSVSDTTGIAAASGAGATGLNAVYSSGRQGGTGVNGGIDEDGNAVGVALIDIVGGL